MSEDEKTVQKLCIILAIFGIVIIFFADKLITPKTVQIGDITEEMVGYVIHVRAVLTELDIRGENSFMTLSDDTGEIFAVFFGESVQFQEKEMVSAIGKIEVYRGKLELILSKIEKIKEG